MGNRALKQFNRIFDDAGIRLARDSSDLLAREFKTTGYIKYEGSSLQSAPSGITDAGGVQGRWYGVQAVFTNEMSFDVIVSAQGPYSGSVQLEQGILNDQVVHENRVGYFFSDCKAAVSASNKMHPSKNIQWVSSIRDRKHKLIDRLLQWYRANINN